MNCRIGALDPTTQWASGYRFCRSNYPICWLMRVTWDVFPDSNFTMAQIIPISTLPFPPSFFTVKFL